MDKKQQLKVKSKKKNKKQSSTEDLHKQHDPPQTQWDYREYYESEAVTAARDPDDHPGQSPPCAHRELRAQRQAYFSIQLVTNTAKSTTQVFRLLASRSCPTPPSLV